MTDHEKLILAWFIYSSVSQALPEPLPNDRWYGFAYRFIHLLGLNLRPLLSTARDTRIAESDGGK